MTEEEMNELELALRLKGETFQRDYDFLCLEGGTTRKQALKFLEKIYMIKPLKLGE